jgi:large repetitive protein
VHSLLHHVAAVTLAAGLAFAPVAAIAVMAGVPPPPGAVADTYSVDEDTAMVVEAPGLLANDNPGLTTCIPEVDATGLMGEVDVQPDGAFTYTPPDDFNGETTFVYGVQADGGLDCPGPAESQATVTLTVNAVNDAPTAKADTFQGLPDRTLNVAAPGVLLNDGDVDGDSLVAVKETNPVHGNVTLAEDGAFSYTPNAGYVGPDVFSYRASDGTATSPVRAVRITVTAIPTAAPTAAATPTPTEVPTPTEEPSPTPSAEVSASPDVIASASAGPSIGTSPSPGASLSPVPAAGDGGLSIPVLVVGLLLLSLLAFGAAVFLPKWLERQRAGDSIDEGPPGLD